MLYTFFTIFFFKNIIPEIFLIFFLLFFVIFLLFLSNSKIYNYPLINSITAHLTLFFFIFLFLLYFNNVNDSLFILNNSFYICNSLNYIKLLVIFFSIFSILITIQFLKDEKINDFEYFILLIFSILGIILLISSNDFLITYLSIELQSLIFYVLVSFKKNTIFSTEAGIKYFILGSLASIILLFGFSLIYYTYGTLNFNELYLLNIYFNNDCLSNLITSVYILIIISGIFIKLALVPFHFWSPDVYEGAPTSITIFLSTIPKISFLILFFRLIFFVFNYYNYQIFIFIILISIFSIFGGTFFSIKQKKFKRLLAYSSITHVGFLLISLSTGTLLGFQSFIIYLILYLIMSLNIWSIYISLRIKNKNILLNFLTNFNSLLYTNPIVAHIFILNLFSMAGIPPLAGFWSKYLIFLSLIDINFYYFSIIIIFLSSISVFYYLKIIKNIYFNKNKTHLTLISFKRIPKLNSIIILVSFIFIFFAFIIYPDFLLILSNLIIYSFFF